MICVRNRMTNRIGIGIGTIVIPNDWESPSDASKATCAMFAMRNTATIYSTTIAVMSA